MKIRQIISGILMVILTILLVFLAISTSIVSKINSSSIIKIMNKSGYFEKSEKSAQDILNNYLPKDKTSEVLNNVSTTSQIKEMVHGLDNNTVTAVANEKKDEIKKAIIDVLDKDIDLSTRESFAETVSNAYIKAIFPVSEFNILSSINSRYSQKIVLALIIVFIISLAIYIFLASKTKTFKWAIIALYNAIIFSGIILILSSMFGNVKIGNINTSDVILRFVKEIRINITIGITIIFLLSLFSNWKAYFKAKKYK